MTREELKRLMQAHDVTVETLADKLLASTHTVRSWLLPATSKAHRKIRPSTADHIRRVLGRS